MLIAQKGIKRYAVYVVRQAQSQVVVKPRHPRIATKIPTEYINKIKIRIRSMSLRMSFYIHPNTRLHRSVVREFWYAKHFPPCLFFKSLPCYPHTNIKS